MKFKFELDDIDTDNLYSVLNTNRMRAFTRLIDAVNNLVDPPTPQTVACLIEQYRYGEELMNIVFDGEVIHMDLSTFDNYV